MVDVLENNLRPEAKAVIEYREWSIKNRQGVEIFAARQGKVVPTLCINGEKVFESLIPTLDEIYEGLIARAKSEEQREILKAAWRLAEAEYQGS
jgi:hypothetical protein